MIQNNISWFFFYFVDFCVAKKGKADQHLRDGLYLSKKNNYKYILIAKIKE